jgi:hypothetical protein
MPEIELNSIKLYYKNVGKQLHSRSNEKEDLDKIIRTEFSDQYRLAVRK